MSNDLNRDKTEIGASSTTSDSKPGSSVIVPSFSGTPTVTTMKLDRQNYSPWSIAVKIWFVGQGVDDHLFSDCPSDVSTADKRAWIRVDAQLVSLL